MAVWTTAIASANVFSFTGTLPQPADDYVTFLVTLTNPGILEIQTYGFGGGTNVHSQNHPARGVPSLRGCLSRHRPQRPFP